MQSDKFTNGVNATMANQGIRSELVLFAEKKNTGNCPDFELKEP